MKKVLIKLVFALSILSQVALVCSGTETGNPSGAACLIFKNQADPAFLDDLIGGLCEKITSCGVGALEDCVTALNGADGDRLLDELGLLQGLYTISSLRESLEAGAVVANASGVSACEIEIEAVTCGEVTVAVSVGNFSTTETLMPNICQQVFAASPDNEGTGSDHPECP